MQARLLTFFHGVAWSMLKCVMKEGQCFPVLLARFARQKPGTKILEKT